MVQELEKKAMRTEPIKILLAEDDQDIREIMTMVLSMEGYIVTGLDNGHEVLGTAQVQHPDVILLDVLLGDTDGREICRALKADANTRAIPVMIVSATHGYSDPGAAACGANDYLGKPFDIHELIARIKRLAA